MAGLSEDDRLSIGRHLAEAKNAHGKPVYSAEEIAGVIDDMDKQAGGAMLPTEEATYHPGKVAIRTLGPLLGGAAGAGLLARSAPLLQAVAEGAGVAGGDIGARKVTGEPQDIRQSLLLGAGAGTIGGIGRKFTEWLGGLGGVAKMATKEAGVPTRGLPSYQKVGLTPRSTPSPASLNALEAGESAESGLADRVRNAVSTVQERVTPERAQKVTLLKQAEQSGARVNPMPVLDKIAEHQVSNAFMPDAIAFNEATNKAMDNYMAVVERHGGQLTPLQMDEIIRTQLGPKAYSASGDPTMTRIGAALRDAKTAATQELNRSLPPNIAKLNERISAKLDAIDEADSLFGPDRSGVINRLRNLFNPGNEDQIKSLGFLAKESGDSKLTRHALDLATRREFTSDIRALQPGQGRPFMKGVEAVAKTGTRVMAPLQPYYGGGAAALRRYYEETYGKKPAQGQPLWTQKKLDPQTAKPEEMFPGMTHSPAQESP